MLASQRGLFGVPREICYLNSASYSPLPLRTQEVARDAVGRKAAPWTLDADFANRQHERARAAAARLINAEASDVALISSVSYGVATVGRILAIPADTRVLVLENDHSSPILEWQTRAGPAGFSVETVRQPLDGDWTAAVLASIERVGAPRLALASISSVHWSDGGMIDIAKVGAALKRQGALLLIDATQAVGVIAMDVKSLDPDFVIFPTYKWLLGPYGRAFIYIARRHQNGIPLEQTGFSRREIRSDAEIYFADVTYVTGARRFDMGQRDHFISMEMAAIGMEMMAEWGADAVAERLKMLTSRMVEGLSGSRVRIMDARFRAPHILSLNFAGGLPGGLVEALAADGIYVAPRLARMRVSPHVFNDEEDGDRFVAALKKRI
ncbi:aminotransferase class V-fold PLP-dependent enzyme [Bradyrhizobium sp.]|uniref:aminotransferase class V-fold PLP-dependent enzyme n=1 Tax=Bradyrhizobium sp. TaxID=376 RepID=UPI00260DD714|nr:aminotransferase class V-fold PLP-dependent enzyme [Bradyrhizobium sp.]